MTSQPKTCLTPEEYLAMERQNEYRKCSTALREVYDKVSLPPSDLEEGELL